MINPETVYAILSRDDFLGVFPGQPIEETRVDDYLSFCFDQPQFATRCSEKIIPVLDASERQLAKFASDKPHVATMLLMGYFFGNQAFVEELSALDSRVRAFPIRLGSSDVAAFIVSTCFEMSSEYLDHSERIVYRRENLTLPKYERPIHSVRRLVVTQPDEEPLGLFRLPHLSQVTFVAGEMAEWFDAHAQRLEISLHGKAKLHPVLGERNNDYV